MVDSEIVDRSLARGCNPPSVAVNVVTSTSTIGQCSATVVTVPSSGCASVYAGQWQRHPVTVVRLPSAGVVSRLAQTQSAVTIGLPSQSNTTVRQVNFNVKVINPDKKKDYQVYVLRDVHDGIVSIPQELVEEVQKQFGPQLVPTTHPIPVGYMKGSTIRSTADVHVADACKKG